MTTDQTDDNVIGLPARSEAIAPITMTPGATAESVMRSAITEVTTMLAAKRAQRDQINADIRGLVNERETLAQAIKAFDRAAKKATD